MSVLFVAGSGTDVGKTYVSVRLIEHIRAAGRRIRAVKPVLSGAPAWDEPAFEISDTARLLQAQQRPRTREEVEACSPWRFAAPLAPDAAAAREGRTLALGQLLDFHRACLAGLAPDETLLIEGVGGVMSPVARDATGLDWLKALGCPALLVCGDHLGGVSQALTACETLARHEVALSAVVVSAGAQPPMPLDETVEAIARRCASPVIGLARGAGFEAPLAFGFEATAAGSPARTR